MVTIITVAAAALLIFIGALLGATWTGRLLPQWLHEQASQQEQERRMLAKEWAAVHQRRRECPRCTNPLTHPDHQLALTTGPD
jgi:hypothetical protein